MSVHKVRYIIDPVSACPTGLLVRPGVPSPECEVDTDFVAACAMREVFQTAGAAWPLAFLFEELLAPGELKLVWRGAGPGRGKEMRRAFSGLFGRFFAPAYLARYHGFTWFVPIDRDPSYVSDRLRVGTIAGSELPDWICGLNAGVAIAEAKGSHQAKNVTAGGVPGPIKTAERQIGGVMVEQLQPGLGIGTWLPRSVKGWAVMSRWGIENPARDAFQYVLDPPTHGEAWPPEGMSSLFRTWRACTSG